MYLSEIRVFNYKSFLDSGPIQLKPGFNVLTGQNNAGKTALLEALSLRFSEKPHRSLLKAPAPGMRSYSSVLATVLVTQEELQSRLSRSKSGFEVIPLRKKDFAPDFFSQSNQTIWESVMSCRDIQFDFLVRLDMSAQMSSHYRDVMPGWRFDYFMLERRKKADGDCSVSLVPLDSYDLRLLGSKHEVGSDYGLALRANTYGFRAERMNVGISSFGSGGELEPDASNLPTVLHVLQSVNPARFKRYNEMVKRVFPQVEWISVRPVASMQVEILVWSVEPETERADLAVPLSESGTGISQVLAMLYVLVTSEHPRTILIDEPNSFLHPGAVRALVEILREHPQHQYILSTHSSELIAACNPSTIHILRRTQGNTQVESVNTQEARHFRTLLMEVGSRPSDVFGAEHVLWVEGPTEQLCFPLIARHFLRRPLAGVSIVGVLHTGDFDAKKDTRSVFRIYERLTQQGSALMPPAVAFIFDREIRPDKDREDLERQSKGKVHFLSRRTYENYLLDAQAIAAVLDALNTRTRFSDETISQERIKTWLDEHVREVKYYGKAKSHDYPREIDAPMLLHELFHAFSGNTLEYNKVEHSLALTEWLLENKPEELKEIGDLLDKVLPVATPTPTPKA